MRGKGAESLVRADGVVDAFPSLEIAIEGREVERLGDDLIELLGMGTPGRGRTSRVSSWTKSPGCSTR